MRVPSRLPVRRTPIPPRLSQVLDSDPRQALLERSDYLWAIHRMAITTTTQFTAGFCCVDGPFELSGVRQTTADYLPWQQNATNIVGRGSRCKSYVSTTVTQMWQRVLVRRRDILFETTAYGPETC